MTVKQNEITGKWSYRFQVEKQIFSGVCHGCKTRGQALAYENKILSASSRLIAQKTINDLYENCRDMLLKKKGIKLKKAFYVAMRKPQRRKAGETRQRLKEQVWNDFLKYMTDFYPDIAYAQSVTPIHAEAYIGFLRSKGFYTKFRKNKNKILACGTLNNIQSVLLNVFSLLKNEQGMPPNPFAGIAKVKAIHMGHEPYSLEELRLIFQNADDTMRPLFMIGLFSGLRLGDICTLKKSEIYFDRHFIVRCQRKTSGMASIPMHPILENYLRTLCEKNQDNDYLLPELAAQYESNHSVICHNVTKFLNSIGIVTKRKNATGGYSNIKGIHSLRHTFCTIAGIVGIPEVVVRSIVGHMTRQMSELYTRHIEEGEKLKYIQLFGEKISEVEGLPAPEAEELEPSQPTPLEERMKAVAKRGGERNRLVGIIRQMPIEEVRMLLIELENKHRYSTSIGLGY